MDQSQMPAEPLESMTPGELVANLSQAEPVIEGSAKENRTNAARELEMITELTGSAAFQWFEKEFIDAPYAKAFEALRSKRTKPEDFPDVRSTYNALQAIKADMIQREITHRELLSPTDPRISFLLGKLAAL